VFSRLGCPGWSAQLRKIPAHLYDQLERAPDIGDLLHEFDRDPTAIFWG
jgi:hypothetical protein